MTENQLKYLSYQESARHNAAMEKQDAAELEETSRANREREAQQKYLNTSQIVKNYSESGRNLVSTVSGGVESYGIVRNFIRALSF